MQDRICILENQLEHYDKMKLEVVKNNDILSKLYDKGYIDSDGRITKKEGSQNAE